MSKHTTPNDPNSPDSTSLRDQLKPIGKGGVIFAKVSSVAMGVAAAIGIPLGITASVLLNNSLDKNALSNFTTWNPNAYTYVKPGKEGMFQTAAVISVAAIATTAMGMLFAQLMAVPSAIANWRTAQAANRARSYVEQVEQSRTGVDKGTER